MRRSGIGHDRYDAYPIGGYTTGEKKGSTEKKATTGSATSEKIVKSDAIQKAVNATASASDDTKK